MKQVFGLAAGALLLAGCQTENSQPNDVVVMGKSQENTQVIEKRNDFITRDEAKRIAFEDAGVDGSKATFDDDELDRDDKKYEFEFKVDSVEYEYDIRAETGDILKAERDDKKEKLDTSKTDKKEGSHMSMDEAIAIAFEQVEVTSENQVLWDNQEFDRDDKRYELEFYVNGVEFEFDIHSVTGEILDFEGAELTPSTSLSKEQAIQLALTHAGVTKDNVQFDDVELESDDGIQYWEIEFDSGNYEYEYDIHAKTGDILNHEVEKDN